MKTILSLFFLGCLAISSMAQEPPKVLGGHIEPQSFPRPPAGTRIRIGGEVAASQLVSNPAPAYPPLAKQTRIAGTVRLHAVLAKDGSVMQLDVVSGHPLLVQSALDAVRQWKYKPTLLNGQAVEVDTTVDVIFSLNEDKVPDAPKLMTLVPSVDPQLRTDVLKLLEVNHAKERSAQAATAFFEKMRPTMFPNVKDRNLRDKIADAYQKKLLRMFDSEEYAEGIVVAYSKHFNDDDIKELAKFYASPVGQKFNDAMPVLTRDLIDLGQRLAGQNLPSIFKELCAEYPDELGGQLPDCPAPDKDKKSQLLPQRFNLLEQAQTRR